jgi:hypothetical protein
MDIRYLGKVLIGRVLVFLNQYPVDILMGTSHFYLCWLFWMLLQILIMNIEVYWLFVIADFPFNLQ